MRKNSPSGRIWLIGGTRESAEIAKAIASWGFPCPITVTTATATSLYPTTPWLKVIVGRMDLSRIGTFLQQEQIRGVIDASHPYAVAISQNAIAATTQLRIPYLRYERPTIQEGNDSVIELDSFETLLQGNYLTQQRVLLTVGVQVLPLFQAWQNRATLFARILPAVNSLEVALAAGFTADRLIALRPPISPELEKALWESWGISVVVTKASGKVGGETIKRSLAAELGIPLIVISRPALVYPEQTNDLEMVLAFCRHCIEELGENG